MKSVKSIRIPEGIVRQLKFNGVVLWKQDVLDQLATPTIELNGDILTITTPDDRTEEFVIFVGGVETATVQAGEEEQPDTPETPIEETLIAPTISLDGDTLTMTATDNRTQEFVIFVDGVETATVQAGEEEQPDTPETPPEEPHDLSGSYSFYNLSSANGLIDTDTDIRFISNLNVYNGIRFRSLAEEIKLGMYYYDSIGGETLAAKLSYADVPSVEWEDIGLKFINLYDNQTAVNPFYSWFIESTVESIDPLYDTIWEFNESLNHIVQLGRVYTPIYMLDNISFISNNEEFTAFDEGDDGKTDYNPADYKIYCNTIKAWPNSYTAELLYKNADTGRSVTAYTIHAETISGINEEGIWNNSGAYRIIQSKTRIVDENGLLFYNILKANATRQHSSPEPV